ncbi:uncharacterized protein EMH_0078500 [Eimeria mitis]|uniref:Uncharacterized protein n=1 Tax=Eimeria mitis TaxID=44415 RepID=U6KE99_9EIME|nr:uncharacterized protein EMH_0078500 [Eimeria mitis]CDJ36325.1 hypothetical protein, conserved [Eimeria mitis]
MCLFLNLDKGVTLASKNLRRKSRHFLVSVDRAFDEVLAGCVRRHGENWLWKSVRQVRPLRLFLSLCLCNCQSVSELCTGELCARLHYGVSAKAYLKGLLLRLLPRTTTAYNRLCSKVVANFFVLKMCSCTVLKFGYREVGVSIGRVYTSLTAFTDADSAGTAQLTATRLLLRKAGYELLDLGMNLPYKATLGAKPLPREVFLKLFRRLRDRNATPLDATMQQCHESIQAAAKPQYGTTEQSKGQWVGRQDGTSRTASKDIRGEPTPPAAENVQRLHLPPGCVRCVDLFRLLEGS